MMLLTSKVRALEEALAQADHCCALFADCVEQNEIED
jgi:hypothetical protein